VQATEAAWTIALESMRVHGGYGYTTEFPVERHYRDAARLLLIPDTNEADRAELARALVEG
jgi:alkylation response protein AidB-like acyl-CoA dehydrogenase